MTNATFDTLTSRAATTALSAFSAPLAAEARNRRKKKKKNKRRANGGDGGNGEEPVNDVAPCPDRCPPQVTECRNMLSSICAGSPQCADILNCCTALRSCDAEEFVTCMVEAILGDEEQQRNFAPGG